jgi:hypothetical protein
VRPQITFESDWGSGGLLQNVRRHFDERRASLGNECRDQFGAGTISQIKRATMGIENTARSFDNQTMEIARPNRFAERFSQAVQEIEDQRFLDLDLLLGALQRANASELGAGREEPAGQRREQEHEENGWPHGRRASLLRRCLVMKILF